jgi:hypothetical protein
MVKECAAQVERAEERESAVRVERAIVSKGTIFDERTASIESTGKDECSFGSRGRKPNYRRVP